MVSRVDRLSSSSPGEPVVYGSNSGVSHAVGQNGEACEMVRSWVSLIVGAVLGFGAMVLAIGAGVLLLAGIGGGILVRERPSTARVLNYDPSDVVLRAAITGAAALVVTGIYVVILRRLRRPERRDT